MRIGGLNRFEDPQQRARTLLVPGNCLVDQHSLVSIQNLSGHTLHPSSSPASAPQAGLCKDLHARTNRRSQGTGGTTCATASQMAGLRSSANGGFLGFWTLSRENKEEES